MRMREGQKVRRNKNLASRHGGEFECSRRVFNLNDVNAKFLDQSANLNDGNTNLNDEFHDPDLFANLNDSFIKWNDKSNQI